MKRFTIFVLITLLFASCTEYSAETKSTYSVTTANLEVANIGGYFEVLYDLKDSNGINPVAITEAEWVVDFDNSTQGK
jgi:hypothetical protein